MIFQLNKDFVDSLSGEDLSDLAVKIVTNRHYLCVDKGDTLQKIKEAVDEHASTKQQTLWTKLFTLYAQKRPTSLIKSFCRRIIPQATDNINNIFWLAATPGTVILENAHNEWNTYMIIADTYKSDRKFGSLFEMLAIACKERRIKSIHAGGCGDITSAYNKLIEDERITSDTLNLKNFIVFDRDTDNDATLDSKKRNLFLHVCDKSYESYTNQDIEDMYVLSQPKMGWHMWYKRAIENYFDDQCYTELGMGPVSTEGKDRNYVNINSKTTPKYQKNRLSELAANISRSRLEAGLKMFYCPEVDSNISEMQLFLLKLVKIM